MTGIQTPLYTNFPFKRHSFCMYNRSAADVLDQHQWHSVKKYKVGIYKWRHPTRRVREQNPNYYVKFSLLWRRANFSWRHLWMAIGMSFGSFILKPKLSVFWTSFGNISQDIFPQNFTFNDRKFLSQNCQVFISINDCNRGCQRLEFGLFHQPFFM